MSASTAPPVPEALTPAAVRGWQAYRAEIDRRLGPCFRRSEGRHRAAAYLDGLLSDTRRKNGWQLAETAGHATPYGFQHLLGRAVWSADAARDELYAYVAEHLGDPEGVVVIDETGFPKQGTRSAGVARQYCGALGKVANCQVGVCLAYVGARGHTLLDRELYLPAAWTDDPARLRAAGLAPDTPFATKPQLARRMLARVLDAGLPVAWVTGDTVYGRATELRRWLEHAGQHHVLAVPRNESLWVGPALWTPEAVHAVQAGQEWYRLSAGAGSKGERRYDWQCWVLAEPENAAWGRYLLFRRSLADPGRLAGLRGLRAAGLRPGDARGRGRSLSLPEIRRLLWHLVLQGPRGVRRLLAWPHWRRRHPWLAQCCHYRRQCLKPYQVQL